MNNSKRDRRKLKNATIIVFFLLVFSISNVTALAVDAIPKTLEESLIDINSDGNGNYEINQQISLVGTGDFSGDKIEHTFSRIEDIQPESLQFLYQGEELTFTTEEYSALVRYYVETPDEISDSFDYEVQYNVSVDENVFTTPLFVPEHPASGQDNVVTINFETSAENIIQRNSFPVLKKDEDNTVTSYLMNIPSHTNYIYGAERNILNSFNIVSWTSIIILLAIITIWIRSEVKSSNLERVKK